MVVSSGEGEIARLDADSRDISVFADTLKRMGVDTRHLRRLVGWRVSLLRYPGLLSRAGWRLTLLFGGETVLVAGRGVSPLTGHVSVSLKHILDLA